jgi:hypothetical protein
MNEPKRARRLVLRTLGWSLLLGFAVALYFAYGWAGSIVIPVPYLPGNQGMQVSVRMEEAPFASYIHGHKSWSLWAKQIDLEHLAGSAIANIQSATLTDIRDGKLYALPPESAPAALPLQRPTPTALQQPSRRALGTPHIEGLTPLAPGGPEASPTATFRAQSGVYSLGTIQSIPNDLTLLYEVQWQFKLQGGVDFQTHSGDRLRADSLTILEMINKRTRRTERRILCDSGARVTRHGVTILANEARYDPAERTVECLGGVRGTFKTGTVQADRLFWSLKDEVIRSPETATGTQGGMTCVWDGLTIDMKRHIWHANTFHARIRMEEQILAR